MLISFKGAQFAKDVILFAVFFYVRYTVSYRDLEEIMAERGGTVDHATLNRWVAKYSPLIANSARRRKVPANRSWRRFCRKLGSSFRAVEFCATSGQRHWQAGWCRWRSISKAYTTRDP